MRLSEAIALGRVTIEKPEAGNFSTCAMGMAANAVGMVHDYKAVLQRWPWLWRDTLCPVNWCCEEPTSAIHSLTHQFDYFVMLTKSMTLDQLIDWVRSVEPSEVEATNQVDSEIDVRYSK